VTVQKTRKQREKLEPKVIHDDGEMVMLSFEFDEKAKAAILEIVGNSPGGRGFVERCAGIVKLQALILEAKTAGHPGWEHYSRLTGKRLIAFPRSPKVSLEKLRRSLCDLEKHWRAVEGLAMLQDPFAGYFPSAPDEQLIERVLTTLKRWANELAPLVDTGPGRRPGSARAESSLADAIRKAWAELFSGTALADDGERRNKVIAIVLKQSGFAGILPANISDLGRRLKKRARKI
jgi:hypothetical protein